MHAHTITVPVCVVLAIVVACLHLIWLRNPTGDKYGTGYFADIERIVAVFCLVISLLLVFIAHLWWGW